MDRAETLKKSILIGFLKIPILLTFLMMWLKSIHLFMIINLIL